MRYNPPPNWPKPPKGWVPHPDWSPDPSWPPPPPGWRLWLDEDNADERAAKSAMGLKHAGDDGEYFGGDVAWADDSGPAPADEDLDALDGKSAPQPTEVAPKDLGARHLGSKVTVKWDDERTYHIGEIVAVTADTAAINVKLAGVDTPVSFHREPVADGPANPRIFVWI